MSPLDLSGSRLAPELTPGAGVQGLRGSRPEAGGFRRRQERCVIERNTDRKRGNSANTAAAHAGPARPLGRAVGKRARGERGSGRSAA